MEEKLSVLPYACVQSGLIVPVDDLLARYCVLLPMPAPTGWLVLLPLKLLMPKIVCRFVTLCTCMQACHVVAPPVKPSPQSQVESDA